MGYGRGLVIPTFCASKVRSPTFTLTSPLKQRTATFYILYLFTLRVLTPPGVGEALYDGIKMAVNRQSLQGLGTLIEKSIPHLFNYTLFVPLAMSCIFIGSTPLTEGISAGKCALLS